MRCLAFDSPGTSARRFRGFLCTSLPSLPSLLPLYSLSTPSLRPLYSLSVPSLYCSLPSFALFALSGLPPTFFWVLRSFRCCLPTLFCTLHSFLCCLPTFFCAPRSLRATCRLSFALLALSGLPADSLLRSSLFPVLLANSLKPLLALPGCASAGRAPCMFRHGCPPSVPPPIPGSRPWHPAAAQPTLFWTLRSFRCCLLLSSAPPRSPRVCPGRTPVFSAKGALLLFPHPPPIPGSRPWFPPVVPGRDTRPRHPAAVLSHRARVPILAPPCPRPVLSFFRGSVREMLYI